MNWHTFFVTWGMAGVVVLPFAIIFGIALLMKWVGDRFGHAWELPAAFLSFVLVLSIIAGIVS